MQSLSTEQLQRACCRLAGAPGGLSLLKTLVQDQQPSPERPPGEQVPEWCICGRCRPMDTPTENVCCRDIRCITTFDHFHLLCLNHPVLTVAIHNRCDIYADPVDYSPASYRKAAYRQFILWQHGYLGKGNRRVIPSCCVWCIRNWYPAIDGVYMGFKEY